MTAARTTYDCHACGADVDAQARRCHYCTAPVATVRCVGCFHMNVPEASFCSGCGRELGLEPLGEVAELPCPVCKVTLTAYREKDGALFDCAQCGGQFVEHSLLRDLIQRHVRPAGTAPASRPAPVPDPRNSYIPCPACAALMNRKNFGTSSGVIVDVCKKHGTFFDLGELPRVLAFVASGGLDRSHAAAEEEAARSRRDARIAAVSVSTPMAAHGPHITARDIAMAAEGVAEWLIGHLLH